jgi:hypothetical protein
MDFCSDIKISSLVSAVVGGIIFVSLLVGTLCFADLTDWLSSWRTLSS